MASQLRAGNSVIGTREAVLGAVAVVRAVARATRTQKQRREVLAAVFETREGQLMLMMLEKNLGLALVPVEDVR